MHPNCAPGECPRVSSNRITYLESALEMSQLGPVTTTIMSGMTPEPSQSSLTVGKAALECGTALPSLQRPLVAPFLLARKAPVLPALPQDKCHTGQWGAHNMQASPW